MTDLRKAAEMALAKLDHLWEIAVDERMGTDVLPEIKALRQALDQQEQLNEITRQFVGVNEDGSERWVETEYCTVTKREWVGLDEDRVAYLADKYAPPIDPAFQNDDDYWKFYQEVEAELKEKNGG